MDAFIAGWFSDRKCKWSCGTDFLPVDNWRHFENTKQLSALHLYQTTENNESKAASIHLFFISLSQRSKETMKERWNRNIENLHISSDYIGSSLLHYIFLLIDLHEENITLKNATKESGRLRRRQYWREANMYRLISVSNPKHSVLPMGFQLFIIATEHRNSIRQTVSQRKELLESIYNTKDLLDRSSPTNPSVQHIYRSSVLSNRNFLKQ